MSFKRQDISQKWGIHMDMQSPQTPLESLHRSKDKKKKRKTLQTFYDAYAKTEHARKKLVMVMATLNWTSSSATRHNRVVTLPHSSDLGHRSH